jgi:cardiolipin synthase
LRLRVFALNLLPVTTANKITILRILLIPFFVVELIYYVRTGNEIYRLAAIVCFALAAIFDGVDGYIARHYNQKSELGAILDPIADKLLLVSAIVMMSFDNTPYFPQVPLWFTGTIIGRDVLLFIGAVVIYYTMGKVNVRPHITGKVATVFQMLTISWILLHWNFKFGLLEVWMAGAAILTGVSGLLYVLDGTRQLSSHPASSAETNKTDKTG